MASSGKYGSRGTGSFVDYDVAVTTYLKQIEHFPLLTADEEVSLFSTLQDVFSSPDQKETATTRIINGNLRLVISIAKRYRSYGPSFIDLIQEGNVGLMLAVSRFDLSRNTKFSTYATYWIKQSILRCLDKNSRVVRLPPDVRSLVVKLKTAQDTYLKTTGDKLPVKELAAQFNLSDSDVITLLKHTQAHVSLDSPTDDEQTKSLGDFVPDKNQVDVDSEAILATLRERLAIIVSAMPFREREVIKLRYGLEDGFTYTLDEIASMFNLTRERIRQIEAAALDRLKVPTTIDRLKSFVEDKET